MPENIVLLACGSFNPPTPMHFRMFGECEYLFGKICKVLLVIFNICRWKEVPAQTQRYLSISEYKSKLKGFFFAEIARDNYRNGREGNVIGGVVSPVHDSYKKPNVQLINSSEHRCKMINLSLKSSDWIRLSTWECKQKHWSPTLEVLQHHQVSFALNLRYKMLNRNYLTIYFQNYLNSILNDGNENELWIENVPSWMPNISEYKSGQIKVKLLCGADLLESFANRNLWNDTDVRDRIEEMLFLVQDL